MNISTIYLFAAWGILLPLLFFRILRGLSSVFPRPHLGPLKSFLLHAHVLPRRVRGTHTIVVLHASTIVAYLALNVVALLFRANDIPSISKRSADICLINLTLLALGAVPSPMTELFLSVPRHVLRPTHFWVGRIAVLQMTVHAMLETKLRGWVLPKAIELTAASVAVVAAVVPSLILRFRFYEIVSRIHSVLALALIGILWSHLAISRLFNWVCLTIITAVTSLQWIFWLCNYLYRNKNFRGQGHDVKDCTQKVGSVTKLVVPVVQPWSYIPGQYINLRVTGLRKSGLIPRSFQSHPFCIAWYDDLIGVKPTGSKGTWLKWRHNSDEQAKLSEIHVLVRDSHGLSGHIHEAEHAFIDGPYGGLPDLLFADKLILVSSGIGIASHLATVKYILELPLNKCVPRRVDLVWYAEDLAEDGTSAASASSVGSRKTRSEFALVKSYLQELIDNDTRQLLCIHTCDPIGIVEDLTAGVNSPARRAFRFDPALSTHKRIDQRVTVKRFLERHIEEWQRAEAGKTAFLVCGSPIFEQKVRQALRCWNHEQEIQLFYSEFEPDE